MIKVLLKLVNGKGKKSGHGLHPPILLMCLLFISICFPFKETIAQAYCTVSSSSCLLSGTRYGFISNVTLTPNGAGAGAPINNTTGNGNCGATNQGYSNYSAVGTPASGSPLSTSVTAGQTVSFSVTRGSDGSTGYTVQIYVDFDGNGTLNNAGELVYTSATNATATQSSSFTVPAGTSPGNKRLRVRNIRTGQTLNNPCNNITYGEAEDYTLTVLASCTQPTQASGPLDAAADFTSIMINDFTRGDGDNVLIVARTTATPAVAPSGGVSYLTADEVFNNGQSTTGAGNYVVFNGDWISGTTTLDVTNLLPGTSYTFDVYEYNNTGVCYKTPGFSTAVSTLSCTPPTPQANSANTSNVGNTSMDLTWTRGGGNNVIVLARSGGAVNSTPVSGASYTANSVFGTGSQIGSGNYVIYSGTGSSVTVSGMSPGTAYHFAVFEFDDGPPKCYNTSSPALANNSTTNTQAFISSTTTQNNADVNKNTTNQMLVGLQVVVTGTTSLMNVSQITFNTNGTTDAALDIANARIYYTGTTSTFSAVGQFGSTIANPNGSHIVTGSQNMANGINYFWLTYDIPSTATIDNYASAAITEFEITGVSGQNAGVKTPTSTTTANRKVSLLYCTPTAANNCGTYGAITNVTIAGVGNSSGCASTSTAYSNFTGLTPRDVTEGLATSFSVSRGSDGFTNYDFAVYVDLNNDGDFTDGGEAVYVWSSGNTSGSVSSTFTIPNGTSLGTHRIRFRNIRDGSSIDPCASVNFGEAEDYLINVLSSTPMTYVSSTTTQNTAPVGRGTANQQVIGIQVVTSGGLNPLSLTSLTIRTNGTTSVSDISNARIYYTGTSSNFSASNQFGSTIASPNGTHVINGSRQLATGTNYFWLTYDIPAGATLGNLVDAQCTSLTIDNVYTPTVTAPSGARTITLAYCNPVADNCNLLGTNYGYISSVSIAGTTLNNSSGGVDCGSTNTGYSDFTSITPADLIAGNNYNFSVSRGSDGFTGYFFAIWIDLNNDGAFTNTDYHAISNPSGERFFNEAASASGSVSGSITIPWNTDPGSYRMRWRNIRNNSTVMPCGNVNYGEAEDYQITVSVNTWIGNTTDWATPSNWTWNEVPTCATDGLIPTSPAGGNFPLVTASAEVRNLTIKNAARVTTDGANLRLCGNWLGVGTSQTVSLNDGAIVMQGVAAQIVKGSTRFDILHVNNSLGVTLDAGANISINNGLHLQSGQLNISAGTLRLLSTSASHAAYIDDFSFGVTPGTINGNVQIDRFIPVAGRNQHFISSPTNSLALSNIDASGPDGSFITPTGNCDETQSATSSIYGSVFVYEDDHQPQGACKLGNWMVKSAGNMENGKGYSAYLIGNSIKSVSGVPNTGNLSVGGLNNKGGSPVPTLQSPLTPVESGWNLIGNPYPSSIHLTTSRIPEGFSNQVQIWVTSGPFSGGWISKVITQDNDIYIAPFQAFMVLKTSPGNNGSYPFYQSERVRQSNTSFYRNGMENSLTLLLAYNGMEDITTVQFNSDATVGFDDEFDANKSSSAPGKPMLYTYAASRGYSINTLPSLMHEATVLTGLRAEVNGTMSITAQGLNSFDPTTYIFLEDKQTKVWHNLRTGAYTFNTKATDAQDRFVLHFTPPAEILTTGANCSENGVIHIEQKGGATWNYTLKDQSNNVVSSGVLNEASPIGVNVTAGTYTLELSDNNGYTVMKNIQVDGSEPIVATFTMNTSTAQVNDEISFSASTVAATYVWDLGDGNTSTQSSALHQYLNEGIYTVKLTVTNAEGCQSTMTQTITITSRSATGISNLANTKVNIWSAANNVYIDFSGEKKVDAEIEMYNVIGQRITREKFGRSTIYSKEIPNLEAAYIIIKVTNDNITTTKRVFIGNVK